MFKYLLTMIVLMLLLVIGTYTVHSEAVYASGSVGGGTGPTNDPISRRIHREAERLYNQGRRIFRKRIACAQADCLVGEDVIKRSNAADYLEKFNNEAEFLTALDAEEREALSAYMNKRYRLEIE